MEDKNKKFIVLQNMVRKDEFKVSNKKSDRQESLNNTNFMIIGYAEDKIEAELLIKSASNVQ